GYSIDVVEVVCNDGRAMYASTRATVYKARKGGGPGLVEATTYRMSFHNTTDNPSRYQDPKEYEEAKTRDPIERVQKYLASIGLWDAKKDEAWTEELRDENHRAVKLAAEAQAFHQIGPQLGKYRQRSRGRYHCQVTIRAPFGGGIRSPEFHSDAVEAQFVQSPGIKIVMPSNPYDAKGLLIEAIRDPDPVLFCEPDRLYRSGKAEVPDGAYTVPFGKASLVREGDNVTLVAWSAAVELCLRAADALAADGISAAVLDLRTLVPLDVETLCT